MVWNSYRRQQRRLQIAPRVEELENKILLAGLIQGTVFEDTNGNGIKESGEPGLQSWNVYLDQNQSGEFETGEQFSLTDSSGNYAFTDLPDDTYFVTQEVLPDWEQVLPSFVSYEIVISTPVSSFSASLPDFGNFKLVDITGHVFEDLNGNHVEDSGELPLEGFSIELSRVLNGELVAGVQTSVSDSNGDYGFEELGPGNYVLRQIDRLGWDQSKPETDTLIGSAPFQAFSATTVSQSPNGPELVYYDELVDGSLTGGSEVVDHLISQGFQHAASSSAVTLVDNGDSDNRIDVVFLGDGYQQGDLPDYEARVAAIIDPFFNAAPLNDYSSLFNVHRVDLLSNETGVDNDPSGVQRDTALDMGFDCAAFQICVDAAKALTQAAAARDSDQIIALANSSRFGGLAYTSSNVIAIPAAHSSTVSVALHEFGHTLADLADEYFSTGTYSGPEPFQPNISTLDAQQMAAANSKWHLWLDHPDVGTFEGAWRSYSEGIFRPMDNSRMRSNGGEFGPVNTEQIVLSIYKTVRPIDSATVSGIYPENTVFTVEPIVPVHHTLDIQWFVDGTPIVGEIGQAFDTAGLNLAQGVYKVDVKVVDNTDLVRDEAQRAALMTETRTWTLVVSDPAIYQVIPTSGDLIVKVDFGQEPVPEAVIEGFVFEDLNRNSVKDDGESGLPNWDVFIDSNLNDVWDVGEPTVQTLSGGLYSFDQLWAGDYSVRQLTDPAWTLIAPSSGLHSVTLATNGTVSPGNNFAIADTTAPELNNLSEDLTVEASSPNGAQVTFSLPTAEDVVDPAPSVSCSPISGHTFPLGSSTVTCTATDYSGNVATGKFTIAVEDTTPPILSPIGNKSIDELKVLSFSAAAHDDVSDFRFRLVSGAPGGAVIDPITGLFQWEPDETHGPGDHPLTVEVFQVGSPQLKDSENITISVSEINSSPALVGPDIQIVEVGETLSYVVEASDIDFPQNDLMFGLGTAAPEGVTIDSETGELYWDPPPEVAASVVDIPITVSDNGTPPLTDQRVFRFAIREIIDSEPVIETLDIPFDDARFSYVTVLSGIVTIQGFFGASAGHIEVRNANGVLLRQSNIRNETRLDVVSEANQKLDVRFVVQATSVSSFTSFDMRLTNGLSTFNSNGTQVLQVRAGAHADTITVGQSGQGEATGEFRDVLWRGSDWQYSTRYWPSVVENLLGSTAGVRIKGNRGDDHVTVDPSIDVPVTLFGGAGNDLLRAGPLNDSLLGDAGNDTLSGGKGNDRLLGSDGHDRMIGGKDNDIVLGHRGDDSLFGSSGDDKLVGHAGVDWLTGGAGNDNLFGGSGIDEFILASKGPALDSIFDQRAGGRLDFSASSSAIFLDLSRTSVQRISPHQEIQLHSATAIDAVIGSRYSDTIIGNDLANWLDGGRGHDRINGGRGADTLLGNRGSDSIDGGNGDDAIFGGLGADSLSGGMRDDTLFGGNYFQSETPTSDDSSQDSVHGGTGHDLAIRRIGSTDKFKTIEQYSRFD